MNHGKTICNQLKEIRRGIARDNAIELDIPECTFEGECEGTCPRCEAELQYLERELTLRTVMGKAAVVAGLTLGIQAAPLRQRLRMSHPTVKTTPSPFPTQCPLNRTPASSKAA